MLLYAVLCLLVPPCLPVPLYVPGSPNTCDGSHGHLRMLSPDETVATVIGLHNLPEPSQSVYLLTQQT